LAEKPVPGLLVRADAQRGTELSCRESNQPGDRWRPMSAGSAYWGREPGRIGIIAWKYELLLVPSTGQWAA